MQFHLLCNFYILYAKSKLTGIKNAANLGTFCLKLNSNYNWILFGIRCLCSQGLALTNPTCALRCNNIRRFFFWCFRTSSYFHFRITLFRMRTEINFVGTFSGGFTMPENKVKCSSTLRCDAVKILIRFRIQSCAQSTFNLTKNKLNTTAKRSWFK